MKRRHFLAQSALWGGAMALSTNWIPELLATSSPLSGVHFSQFKGEHQAFLRQFSQDLRESMLTDGISVHKHLHPLLHPVAIIRQDTKNDYLSYRNAGGQIVELEKRGDTFRIRFLDEI